MDPLDIGYVVAVEGDEVEVQISRAELQLEYHGKPYRIGRLGTYVTIPMDRRTLIGAESAGAVDRFLDRAVPERIQGPLGPALERAASAKHTVTIGQAVPAKAVSAAVGALAARFGNRLVTSQAVREQHGNTTTWVPNEPPLRRRPRATVGLQAIADRPGGRLPRPSRDRLGHRPRRVRGAPSPDRAHRYRDAQSRSTRRDASRAYLCRKPPAHRWRQRRRW